jgi:hypothetical protein
VLIKYNGKTGIGQMVPLKKEEIGKKKGLTDPEQV